MPATIQILPTTAAVEAFNRRAVEAEGVLFGIPALTLKRLTEEICRATDLSGTSPLTNPLAAGPHFFRLRQ